MGCAPSRNDICCGAGDVKHGDENSSVPPPDDQGGVSEEVFAFPLEGGGEAKHEEGQAQDKQDLGSVSEGVFAFPLEGGEARREEQPQDKQGPMGENPGAASEDSTPAAKSDSDSRDNDTLTSKLLGSSPNDKVANETAAESSSGQSEQDNDRDNDKNDGGFVETIAEKLGMMSSNEEEDKTAAAATDADANAGSTEKTPAAVSEESTPAAKSDSDSRDDGTLTSKLLGSSPKDKVTNEAAAESSSGQSEQDKDNGSDKGDGGFVDTIAEKLGMISSDEEEDKTAAPAADVNADEDDGSVTGAVIGLLFGGGEARHEEGQPQDKQGPTEEDSTPAAKSGSDSRDNSTLTSKLFGSSPKGEVGNEAAAESTSEQREQDKNRDNDKNDRGFVGMIAEKLGLMPSEEKEDETAAAAADAGPTEETHAPASEDSTPAAKSGSDSRDKNTLTSKLFGSSPKGKVTNEPAAESTSEQSELDKDNDKNDGGFFEMIAEKLGLMPSEEKEDKTAAAAADADKGATT